MTEPTLEHLLTARFGFQAFRPGQREAIETLLERRRLLCIQPTGHGKSILYQLPATMLPGITVVVSPLLALMRDQITQLVDRFGIAAASINSDQLEEENAQAVRAAQAGELKLLFVAPERLDNLADFNFLLALDVGLLVVDEAHCISTWGHDFRPSYRRIVDAVHAFSERRPDLRVLALTATANERTEADIVELLGADAGLAVHRQGMDRPNIALTVVDVSGLPNKLARLAKVVTRELYQLTVSGGSGILYCATRDQTEIVAGFLQTQGLNVVAYHAGLDPDRKRELQVAFTRSEIPVIAATNALGMGIDKSDIRFIVHVDVPGSITAYYQEVGRAGRDGASARGILLFDEQDREVQDYFIRSSQPTVDDFAVVLREIESAIENGDRLKLGGIKARSGLHPTRVAVVLAELLEQGFVKKQLDGRAQVYVPGEQSGTPSLERYRRQLDVRNDELNAIVGYARRDHSCLMQTLRAALGDHEAPACGRCDQCIASPEPDESVEDLEASASAWLETRALPLAATRAPKLSEGLALLDGPLRGPTYATFMRSRTTSPMPTSRLLELIVLGLERLRRSHTFGSVAMMPSRTWVQREALGEWLAEHLGVPHLALLAYRSKSHPAARQGALVNNDQRSDNVKGCFCVGPDADRVPRGAVLLVDDYIGSRATLREAGRTLRKSGALTQNIVPLMLARVRWKLGAPGMI